MELGAQRGRNAFVRNALVRNDFGRGAARLHPVVVVTAFSSTFYVALLSPILPALIDPLGGGALTIGMLFAGNSIAQFVTAPTWGALGDRFGRRRTMLASQCGVIVGFVVFTVAAVMGGSLWFLVIGWTLVGTCDCWVGTAFSCVADTTTPAERTRYFGFLTAGIGSAFIIGPASSAILSEAGPFTPLFLLLTVLIAVLVWGFFSMPESLPRNRRDTALRRRQLNPAAQLREILALPRLRILLLGYFLFWPAVVVLPSNVPTLMTDLSAWSPGRVSTLLLIFGALVVSVQLGGIPALLRRFREVHLAVTGLILAAVAFMMFALFAATGAVGLVYAGVVVFGLGQPLAQTCLAGMMSKTAGPEMQGRVQGAVAATMALAQVVGSLSVGWLYHAVAPAAPYWAVLGSLVATTVLMIVASTARVRRGQPWSA